MTLKSSLLVASALAVIFTVSATGAGHAQVYLGHGRQSGNVQVNLDALDILPSVSHTRSRPRATRHQHARHYMTEATAVVKNDDDTGSVIVDSRGEHRGGHTLAVAAEPDMQPAPRRQAHPHAGRMAAIADETTAPGRPYQGFHEATLTVPAPDDEGHIPPLDAISLNRLQILCNASPKPPVSPLADRDEEVMPAPQMISATTDSVPETMGPASIPDLPAVVPVTRPVTHFPPPPAPIPIPGRGETRIDTQTVPGSTDLFVNPAPVPAPLSPAPLDPAPLPPAADPVIEPAPAPDSRPEPQPSPQPEPHAALAPQRPVQLADASAVAEAPIEIVPQPDVPSPAPDEAPSVAAPVTMQMAALEPPVTAPAAYSGPVDNLRVDFRPGDAAMPGDETSRLDGMVTRLNANPDLRVELRSYAAGGTDMASRARRLSLSRALAVQSYLTDHGIAAGRIDVRALGTAPTGVTPGDRVDMFVMR